MLVFGGDEVYPTPSRAEYHRRLIVPWETAAGDARLDESPHVFAIPGNHDWYDGLSAFARLFCSNVGGPALRRPGARASAAATSP